MLVAEVGDDARELEQEIAELGVGATPGPEAPGGRDETTKP